MSQVPCWYAVPFLPILSRIPTYTINLHLQGAVPKVSCTMCNCLQSVFCTYLQTDPRSKCTFAHWGPAAMQVHVNASLTLG